jgi:hypothetical protein
MESSLDGETSMLYKWRMPTSPAAKRYYLEFGGAMLAYVAVLLVALPVLHAVGKDSVWRFPVAVLPVLPAVAGMAAFVRFLRTLDEMQRRIQFESFGITLALTWLITFTYGFLENAGLPPLSLIWVGPGMVALWGLVSGVVSRRYA